MKKYSETLNTEMKSKFSLNFLLAQFGENSGGAERNMVSLENRISCEVYETSDYQAMAYHKQISSCIKKFNANGRGQQE